MESILKRFSPQQWPSTYWALFALLLWLVVILASKLLRFDAFGIEEIAARALLLSWSVADRIISPAVILGLPDLRALLFMPLGLYWPGSIVAAKVFTLLISFAAAILLYRHYRKDNNDEAALLATGLLLISPILLQQVDSIDTGAYLLLTFALGRWLDHAYRVGNRPLGGWFFLQMLLVLFAVSLHPIGLAYPIALIWEWHINPIDARRQRHTFIGVGCAVIIILLMRMGWDQQTWLSNPFTVFSKISLGIENNGTFSLVLGIISLIALSLILIRDRKLIAQDLLNRTIFIGIIIGLVAADGAWVLLSVTGLLYLGLPKLINLNRSFGKGSLIGQRGIVIITVFIFATLFMQADKAHHYQVNHDIVSPQDKLIMTLSTELAELDDEIETMVMSQWPGKTMLATRRPAFSLPPPADNADLLWKNINGASHMMFDHSTPANKQLGSQLAQLGGVTKTDTLQEGGVIVSIHNTPDAVRRPAHSAAQQKAP